MYYSLFITYLLAACIMGSRELLPSICTIAALEFIPLHLRSVERTDLRVRWTRMHFGDRTLSAAFPQCWNSPAICFAASVDSFKAQLKTHLLANLTPFDSCLWGALIAVWPRYSAI